MLSKEEIEKAKECLKETIQNTYAEGKAIKLNNALKYIEQLESDKQKLMKKLNETTEIKQTADSINFSLPIEVVKEIDKSLSKTNVALENKRLKLREQKLIEKLEEDEYIIESTYSQINGNYFMAQDKLDYIREILSILKEENQVIVK